MTMIYILGGLLVAALFCIAGLLYALGKARGESTAVAKVEESREDSEAKRQWANLMAYNGNRQEE